MEKELGIKMDGKKLSLRLLERLKNNFEQLERRPKVAIVYAGDNSAILNFVKIKKNKADYLGIDLEFFIFPENTSQEKLENEINLITKAINYDGQKFYDGLIVQLPLPLHIDKNKVINIIPPTFDIDLLTSEGQDFFYELGGLDPVTFAFVSLLKEYKINIANKKITIVGYGQLVGQPVLKYLNKIGIEADIVSKENWDIEKIKNADVIISGTGVAGLIKKSDIKDGVVLFDAGTSEEGGVLKGDIDPKCYEVASFYSPVPGGMGPLTVVGLFQNLYLGLLYKGE